MKNLHLYNLLLILVFSSQAQAASISSYDITNASKTGVGGWHHTYSGSITSTGAETADYTGGSGTLNNGIVENSNLSSQLFNYSRQYNPIITLYLDGLYNIQSISAHQGIWANSIPGTITGFDVTIGGTTEGYTTTEVVNNVDVATLGSNLNTLATSTIILSNFQSSWSSYNTFNISELIIQGTTAQVSAVPVPAAVWLMGSGLVGLMGFSRKNKTEVVAA